MPSAARPSDEYNPLPLAARADGSSLLAYRDANEPRIRVVAIDQHDVVGETVFKTEAEEVHARSARTIPLPDGLTPRPGDSLRFVDQAGTRLDGGWDFGCIPSWSVRLIHNGVWAAVCHGDTPNAHRFVVLEAGVQRTILLLNGIPPAYRALGGLSARGADFWLSYLERTGNSVQFHLARISSTPEVLIDNVLTEASDLDYQNGYVYRAYHAPLGDEFVPFPNGDVGWADAAASGIVTLTRVTACTQ